jgi:hypothetical protein
VRLHFWELKPNPVRVFKTQNGVAILCFGITFYSGFHFAVGKIKPAIILEKVWVQFCELKSQIQ